MEWESKVSKKNVSKDLSQEIHDKAAPFITWLKEAEEEESESEEEDDDLEVILSKYQNNFLNLDSLSLSLKFSLCFY